MKSAGFWLISGCGVPLCLFHIVPVPNILVYLLFISFSPRSFLCMVRYRIYSVYAYCGLNAELYFQYSHTIFFRRYEFVLRHPPDFLDLSISAVAFRGVIGISSSTSPSFSSSVSVSVFFRFCILSVPINMFRRISSQQPYFPCRPRKQCLFFG